MGKLKSFAGVYMLYNTVNGMKYIGESGNVLRRLTEHKTDSNSPIHQIGSECFVPIILESEYNDVRLLNKDYRADREAHYIAKFKTDNPRYGYNTLSKQWHSKMTPIQRGTDKRTQMIMNFTKSDPIIMYDTDTKGTWVVLSKKSAGQYLSKDRSHISRSMKTGKRVEQYLFFELNANKRRKRAEEVVYAKLHSTSRNNLSKKSLVRYRQGLIDVNIFCEEWNLPTIDLRDLI